MQTPKINGRPPSMPVEMIGPIDVYKRQINILSGYLQPRSGECLIFGEDIQRMDPLTRRRIALLIEGHVQYAFMTVEEIERYYSAFYPAWNRDRCV